MGWSHLSAHRAEGQPPRSSRRSWRALLPRRPCPVASSARTHPEYRCSDQSFPGAFSARQLRIRGESVLTPSSIPTRAASAATRWSTSGFSRLLEQSLRLAHHQEKSIFLGGSLWDPFDASRTDNSNFLTLSCESGAVGRCAMWGYPPMPGRCGLRREAPATTTSLVSTSKRAAYCGTDKTNDADGCRFSSRIPSASTALDFDNADHVEAL